MATPSASHKKANPDVSLLQFATKEELEKSGRHLETLIETKTNGLSTQIGGLNGAITTLASEFRASQKPQYGNYWAFGSLMLAALASMYSVYSAREAGLRNEMVLLHKSAIAEIGHQTKDNDRFSVNDWHREEDRMITQDRDRTSKNIDWQRLQDAQIVDLLVAGAKREEWQRIYEQELRQRGGWMQGTQETVNRLDERARYHMELDEPTKATHD